MPQNQRTAPWRERFHLKYAPVLREIPALIRLQTFKPRMVPSPKTILIVNCCLIGDFVVSLPATTEFIREHSSAEIDLMVSPCVACLARKLRGVRRIYSSQTVFRRETELVGSDQALNSTYDLVIVLRLSAPARELLANTSYRSIRTYLFPFLRFGLHLAVHPSRQVKQLAEFDFEVFGKPGGRNNRINADEVFDFDEVREPHKAARRTVLVHTGSGSRLYMWPTAKWVELLESLNDGTDLSFVFVGGTEEEERTFEEISLRTSLSLRSAIRLYDILELVMLMRVSHLFIGVDSGPRHLAHLVDLPSVCLLGPGPKSFQPLNDQATVVDENECSRCSTFYCPYTPRCVEKISVDAVVRACRLRLNLPQVPSGMRSLS
jgi:ADP-heptose:LPS heptosyltransferase